MCRFPRPDRDQDVRDGDAQIDAGLGIDLFGHGVALACGLRNHLRRDPVQVVVNQRPQAGGSPLNDGFDAQRGDRRARSECFKAAPVAAAAHRSMHVDRLVAELPGRAADAQVQPAVVNQPPANACTYGQAGQGVYPAPRAEIPFPQGDGAHVVEQHHGHAGSAAKLRRQRNVGPVAGQVRQESGCPRLQIQRAGNADADSADIVWRQPLSGHDRVDKPRHAVDHGSRPLPRQSWDGVCGRDMARVDVDDAGLQVGAAQV